MRGRSAPVPVTVVTGFLGAGKSTLVERWLAELPRAEVAVIVNERGEIGIDGELLAAHVARLREISGGCVCCDSQAELASALEELCAMTPPPARIVIETSGAASPAGVIRAVGHGPARERSMRSWRLDGVITVFDITRAPRTLGFDLAVEQLGFADVVVLSHADRADEMDTRAVEETVARHAPAAVIARSRRGTLPSTFLELLEQRREALRLPPKDTSPAHAAIEAVSFVHDGELDEDRFCDWVERALGDVEARILRIKGIVAMRGVDARVIVQGVGEAIEVLVGAPWGDAPRDSRLVVLGLGLDRASLEAGFTACAADRSARSPEG